MGLTLSGDGILSGAAAAPGSYTFTVVSTNGITVDAQWEVTLDVLDAPPGSDSGLPPPTAGKSFNIERVGGVVKVRCPHDRKLRKLRSPQHVSLYCVVDARDGTVGVTTSKGTGGGIQSGHFWGGIFGLHQKSPPPHEHRGQPDR